MKVICAVFLCLLSLCAAQDSDGETTQKPTTTTQQAPSTSQQTTVTGQTTSTPAPTSASSTVAPTTLPSEPKSSQWFVPPDAEKPCIMAHIGARFTFNYTDADKRMYEVTYDMPANENDTKATGSCGSESETDQFIQLAFNDGWTFSMTFKKMEKSKFAVKTVTLKITDVAKFFPGLAENVTEINAKLENQTLFQATVGQSYLCNADQHFNLTQNEPSIKLISLETVDVQLQPYNTKDKKSDGFAPAQECPADAETSNIVPIAVGAALAGLVLIVLIAYLISRNRGQRGYESV